MEHFLNKKTRKKNYFQIFYNQTTNKIQKPNDKDVSNSNILLRVTDEEKSNQFENIPKIEIDTLEKVDISMKDLTENEKHIEINEIDNKKNEIENSKIHNSGLNIDNNQIKILKNLNCDYKQKEDLQLDKVVQNTVNINDVNKNKNYKRARKYEKSNLFKKFKFS